MTGLNHATTGALISAAVVNPFLAVPVAFVSHFILDAIPHFGIKMSEDVFERNRQKGVRLAVSAEAVISIIALVALPILIRPRVAWWVTLLTMLSAMFVDLIWIYRGIREELTKKVKSKNWIMNFHLKASHHHSHFVFGIVFELAWFSAALGVILWLVRNK